MAYRSIVAAALLAAAAHAAAAGELPGVDAAEALASRFAPGHADDRASAPFAAVLGDIRSGGGGFASFAGSTSIAEVPAPAVRAAQDASLPFPSWADGRRSTLSISLPGRQSTGRIASPFPLAEAAADADPPDGGPAPLRNWSMGGRI